jgi:hypothetical protein
MPPTAIVCRCAHPSIPVEFRASKQRAAQVACCRRRAALWPSRMAGRLMILTMPTAVASYPSAARYPATARYPPVALPPTRIHEHPGCASLAAASLPRAAQALRTESTLRRGSVTGAACLPVEVVPQANEDERRPQIPELRALASEREVDIPAAYTRVRLLVCAGVCPTRAPTSTLPSFHSCPSHSVRPPARTKHRIR